MCAFAGSKALADSGIHKPTDLIEFPWDKKKNLSIFRSKDIDELQAEIAAINAQQKRKQRGIVLTAFFASRMSLYHNDSTLSNSANTSSASTFAYRCVCVIFDVPASLTHSQHTVPQHPRRKRMPALTCVVSRLVIPVTVAIVFRLLLHVWSATFGTDRHSPQSPKPSAIPEYKTQHQS